MPDKEGSDDEKKSTKSVVNKKQKQMMNQEEYVSELKSSTLGSYIKKAKTDLFARGADKMASHQSNPKTTYYRGKDDKIILNRLKGVERASDKLAKKASPSDDKKNTIRGAVLILLNLFHKKSMSLRMI